MNLAAIHHLESVTRILRELRNAAIELFEHHYYPQTFGNFELVVSRGHERLKFTWDGRDSILSVSFARSVNKNAPAPWIHDASLRLPEGEGIYAEIMSQTTNVLSTTSSNMDADVALSIDRASKRLDARSAKESVRPRNWIYDDLGGLDSHLKLGTVPLEVFAALLNADATNAATSVSWA